jgi:DHA2 family multidrug resistance protein
MFMLTLCVIPLLVLVRPPANNAPPDTAHAAID